MKAELVRPHWRGWIYEEDVEVDKLLYEQISFIGLKRRLLTVNHVHGALVLFQISGLSDWS